MTRDEVRNQVQTIVAQQQGRGEAEYLVQVAGAKSMQEAFCMTSLDTVSLQLAMEEAFGIKFATGMGDRGPIDDAWDTVCSIEAMVELVLKFRC